MADKFSPADKKLLLPLLEEKLSRMKKVTPHADTELAHSMYKKELIRLLKKLNSRGYYYE